MFMNIPSVGNIKMTKQQKKTALRNSRITDKYCTQTKISKLAIRNHPDLETECEILNFKFFKNIL